MIGVAGVPTGSWRTISLEQPSPGVLQLELNRPPSNALTLRMVTELHAALTWVAGQDDIRVLVVTGAGGPGSGFCPGADIKHRLGGLAAQEEAEDGPFDPRAMRIPAVLQSMPQVTLAGINGATAGAGLGLATACDLRVAAASARFNTAFLERGAAGDMATAWSLSRVVGRGRAQHLMYFPEKFDASEAERIGLVTKVIPDDEFGPELGRLARRLASASPVALRTIKENFLSVERLELDQYVDLETHRHFHIVRQGGLEAGFKEFVRASHQREETTQ